MKKLYTGQLQLSNKVMKVTTCNSKLGKTEKRRASNTVIYQYTKTDDSDLSHATLREEKICTTA